MKISYFKYYDLWNSLKITRDALYRGIFIVGIFIVHASIPVLKTYFINKHDKLIPTS